MRAVVDAGADAIEIGIPFSDPIMDGRTIQEASQRALDLGATPVEHRRASSRELDVDVPLVVMTYYNLVAHAGHERFAAGSPRPGVDGAILPDLPLDELDGWGDAADAAGVETVLLAAPTTPDERLRAICDGPAASSTACRCWASPASGATSPVEADGDGPRAQGRRPTCPSSSASASRPRSRPRRPRTRPTV